MKNIKCLGIGCGFNTEFNFIKCSIRFKFILKKISVRKSLESRSVTDVERIAQLEKAIKESQFIAEESERRFDETNKKVEVMESDLERTYDRADSAEA